MKNIFSLAMIVFSRSLFCADALKKPVVVKVEELRKALDEWELAGDEVRGLSTAIEIDNSDGKESDDNTEKQRALLKKDAVDICKAFGALSNQTINPLQQEKAREFARRAKGTELDVLRAFGAHVDAGKFLDSEKE